MKIKISTLRKLICETLEDEHPDRRLVCESSAVWKKHSDDLEKIITDISTGESLSQESRRKLVKIEEDLASSHYPDSNQMWEYEMAGMNIDNSNRELLVSKLEDLKEKVDNKWKIQKITEAHYEINATEQNKNSINNDIAWSFYDKSIFDDINNTKVSIIMTAYNSEHWIEKAIISLLNQTHENIEIIIIDDDSSDSTLRKIIAASQKDERIRVISNSLNTGTYVCKNHGITQSIGDYITFMDSDDWVSENYIFRLLQSHLMTLPGELPPEIVYCKRLEQMGEKYLPSNMISPISSFFHKDLLSKVGYFDSVRFGADTEFEMRIRFVLGNEAVNVIDDHMVFYNRENNQSLTNNKSTSMSSISRKKYRHEFDKWHVNSCRGELFIEFPLRFGDRPFPIHNRSKTPEYDSKNFKEITKKRILSDIGDYQKEDSVISDIDKFLCNTKASNNITVSIASIPSRVEGLEKVVKQLLPQANTINVFLNEYRNIPHFLKNSKINIARSQDFGNIGDKGKFWWSDEIEGYHFTCDDDIFYPDNYISETMKQFQKYGDDCFISYHGSILKEDFISYDKSRHVYPFWSECERDTLVNIGGTGVMAYNADANKIQYENLHNPNMADIWVSLWALNNNKPIVTPKRKSDWLYDIGFTNDSIWSNGINNTGTEKDTFSIQNEIIKKNLPWSIVISENIKNTHLGFIEDLTHSLLKF